ncbi:MAG: endolytic transglycosylase MltG, partial [Synergistota bacterium]|nr:endolytic transglycosylase MltG [Synergistota bacterium]
WSLRGRLLKRVLFSDLKIDSDYNTYMNRGLPPGPICVPSRQSWEAALFPDVHKYLYYVLASGQSHVFSKTYEEHLKAIRERNDDL